VTGPRIAGLVSLSLTCAVLACAGTARAARPLRLEIASEGQGLRLTLVPAANLKLNARLKPALELADGTVLRFDSPHLTSDSSYFAEPPIARLRNRPAAIHGTLRASVCGVNEKVCRAVTVEL
jgi:hypothetical protein